MCNRRSKRNRPWLIPTSLQEEQNQRKWKIDFHHGKNKYRLHMLEETRSSFEALVGNNTISNIRKIERAHAQGKTTCYHRPAVVKRNARLERYLHATYSGKL